MVDLGSLVTQSDEVMHVTCRSVCPDALSWSPSRAGRSESEHLFFLANSGIFARPLNLTQPFFYFAFQVTQNWVQQVFVPLSSYSLARKWLRLWIRLIYLHSYPLNNPWLPLSIRKITMLKNIHDFPPPSVYRQERETLFLCVEERGNRVDSVNTWWSLFVCGAPPPSPGPLSRSLTCHTLTPSWLLDTSPPLLIRLSPCPTDSSTCPYLRLQPAALQCVAGNGWRTCVSVDDIWILVNGITSDILVHNTPVSLSGKKLGLKTISFYLLCWMYARWRFWNGLRKCDNVNLRHIWLSVTCALKCSMLQRVETPN